MGALDAARSAGALTVALVAVPDSELGRPGRSRDRGRRRARGDRRLDAAQGGHRAEARPQHDLDDRDGPPREDLREPDGRRRRDERQASGPRPPHRRAGDRSRAASSVDAALADSGGDAKVAIVSLLAGVDVGGGASDASRLRTASSGRRSRREARRSGVPRRRPARAGRRRGRGRRRRRGRPRRAAAVASRFPGFVDLQVNGFAGVDFLGADADGYAEAADALLETGVTAFLPTFITSSEADLSPRCGRCRAASASAGRGFSARTSRARSSPPRGSARTRPAIAATPIRPCSSGSSRRARSRMMTLAPELPGALELVDVLQARGVVVSLGHSNATAAEAHAAFDRGVRTVTHVFNAMRPLTHRDPGHRRCRARAAGRRRAGDRRRRPSRSRRRAAALERRRGPVRARHRRDRRRRARRRGLRARQRRPRRQRRHRPPRATAFSRAAR